MTIQVATPEQIGKFCQLVGQQETPVEQFQALLSEGYFADLLKANVGKMNRHDFQQMCGLQQQPTVSPKLILPAGKVYSVSSAEKLSWGQLIENWKNAVPGCVGHVDPEIYRYLPEFIPIKDEDPSPLNIELEKFGIRMTSDGVESSLVKDDKRMISPARCLILCTQYPDLQREGPIVCTERVCVDRSGGDRVLYARVRGGERELYLPYRDVAWRGHCRFPSSCNVS